MTFMVEDLAATMNIQCSSVGETGNYVDQVC